MKNLLFTAFFLCAIFCVSCNESSEKEHINKAGAPSSVCDGSPTQICNDGLSFVKIGDSIASLPLKDSHIVSVSDTVFATEDYTCFAKVLHLTEGKIIVEGTHFEKEAGAADPVKSHVDGIRVLSSLFETPEKIKVGSPFSALKSMYADSLFEVQPGAGVGQIEVRIPTISRINYLLLQNLNVESAPGTEMYDVSAISADAKIESIIISQ